MAFNLSSRFFDLVIPSGARNLLLTFNLSRFAGVSEAQLKREPGGEILSVAKDLMFNYPITNLPSYQIVRIDWKVAK